MALPSPMLEVLRCGPGSSVRVGSLAGSAGSRGLGGGGRAGSCCASGGALFLRALQGTFPVQSHRPRRVVSSGFQWVFVLAGRAFEGCRIVLRASVFAPREDRAGSCSAPSSSWLFC